MTPTARRRVLDLVLGLVIVAVLLFPLYWMINVSLTRPQDLLSRTPALFPQNPTIDGYVQAIDTQIPSLITSLTIALGTVVLTLALSLPAAFAMSKLKTRGTGAVLFLLLLAQMIPGVILASALFVIYNAIGLLNTYPGLILANATAAVPLAVIILRAFMLQIPDSLLEAARIDGASSIRVFSTIMVPLSRNAIVTASLFAFLFSWADFLNARSLTSGNEIVPFTLSLFRFIGAQTTNWNAVMATAVLASIPATVLLIVAQRYVAAGITAGAVKD